MFNQRLFLVNGRDPPQRYDGTAVAAAGFAAGANQPALDVTTLAGVQVIHNRLYFWAPRQTGFWYGGLFAITGDLQADRAGAADRREPGRNQLRLRARLRLSRPRGIRAGRPGAVQ